MRMGVTCLFPTAGMQILPAILTAGEKCGNYVDTIVKVIQNGGCYLVSLITTCSSDWTSHSDMCSVVIAAACRPTSRTAQ